MKNVYELSQAERHELESIAIIGSMGEPSPLLAAVCLSRVWDVYINFRARVVPPAAVNMQDAELMRDLHRAFQPLVTFH